MSPYKKHDYSLLTGLALSSLLNNTLLFYSTGNTKVLASVFGPRESERRAEMLDDEAKVVCKCNKPPFAGGGERQKKVKNDRKMENMATIIQVRRRMVF